MMYHEISNNCHYKPLFYEPVICRQSNFQLKYFEPHYISELDYALLSIVFDFETETETVTWIYN